MTFQPSKRRVLPAEGQAPAPMASLADLVLAQEELDLEDPTLAVELAELQAKRQQITSRPPSARPPSARPVSARPAVAPGLVEVLAQAEANLDQELEEMDRQLQQQMEDFRRQQRDQGCQGLAPPEIDLAKDVPEDGLEDMAEEPAVEDEPELRQLKILAAQMDEAFPEMPETSEPIPLPAPARIRGGYQEPPDLPDDEVTEFKSVLESLDVRLRALQNKKDGALTEIPSVDYITVCGCLLEVGCQDLRPPEEEAPVQGLSVISNLQRQNKVLRELLSSDGRKGRLHLDAKIFA